MKYFLLSCVFILYPFGSFGLDLFVDRHADYYFSDTHHAIYGQDEFLKSILGPTDNGESFLVEITQHDTDIALQFVQKFINELEDIETPRRYTIAHRLFDMINKKIYTDQSQVWTNTGYYQSLCPDGDQLGCVKKQFYKFYVYTIVRQELGLYIGSFPERPFARFENEFISFKYPNFRNILSVKGPPHKKEDGPGYDGEIILGHIDREGKTIERKGRSRYKISLVHFFDIDDFTAHRSNITNRVKYGETYACLFTSDKWVENDDNQKEIRKKRSDPELLSQGYSQAYIDNIITSSTISYRRDILDSAECK